MKKIPIRCILISLILLITTSSGTLVAAAHIPEIEPMYVGLIRFMPEISISPSGVISCKDTVRIEDGYTANATWELQSGTSKLSTIFTWKDSGTIYLSLAGKRDAIHGYSYRLKASVKVYNSSGTLVDDAVKYSRTVSY